MRTPPELSDWHKQLSHILTEVNMPTPEEIDYYKVAWGESQVAQLTNWRYWEVLQDQALEIIRRQAIDIEELQTQIRNMCQVPPSDEDI